MRLGAAAAPSDRLSQGAPVVLSDPEPGHVEGHGEELALTLEVDGGVRLDEHHRGGTEVGGVQPVVARVEVEQDDAAGDILTVQILELSLAAPDQSAVDTAVRQCRGAHEIGPQAVQAYRRAADNDEDPRMIDRDGDVILVQGDSLQADVVEPTIDVQCRLFGARIADDAGPEAGEETHRLPQPLFGSQ